MSTKKQEPISMAGFYTDGIDHSHDRVNISDHPKVVGCISCTSKSLTITDEEIICHHCGNVLSKN